jgi:2-polyprenyl-3-methyl-5-hydroxy-6-metoxy-1,4-benzoquinol methylase
MLQRIKSLINGSNARASTLRTRYDRGDSGAIDAIKSELAHYHFYHTIEVVPGLQTTGHFLAHVYQDNFEAAITSIDFAGKSVLDVGCRDGAMLFMAEQRGADMLVGVDNDISRGLTNFLIPFRLSKIKSLHASAYDLDSLDLPQFDIVISAGLLYHLAYPMWGMRKLVNRVKPNGMLLIETALLQEFDDLPVVLYTSGEQSPFEPSSPTFFNLAAVNALYKNIGMSEPKVLRTFAEGEHDISATFPAFAATEKKKIKISRMVFAATKTELNQEYQDYFDGLHDCHSTLRERRR